MQLFSRRARGLARGRTLQALEVPALSSPQSHPLERSTELGDDRGQEEYESCRGEAGEKWIERAHVIARPLGWPLGLLVWLAAVARHGFRRRDQRRLFLHREQR